MNVCMPLYSYKQTLYCKFLVPYIMHIFGDNKSLSPMLVFFLEHITCQQIPLLCGGGGGVLIILYGLESVPIALFRVNTVMS